MPFSREGRALQPLHSRHFAQTARPASGERRGRWIGAPPCRQGARGADSLHAAEARSCNWRGRFTRFGRIGQVDDTAPVVVFFGPSDTKGPTSEMLTIVGGH